MIYRSYAMNVVFKEFRSHFLPDPHDSHCLEYPGKKSGKKWESRGHCVESCAVNLSLIRNNAFSGSISAAYDWNLAVRYTQRMQHREQDFLLSECEKRCSHRDCHTIKYAGMYFGHTDPSYLDWCQVRIHSSPFPLTITQSVAFMDLTTSVTNSLSSISFWTGVAPLGLLMATNVVTVVNSASIPQISPFSIYRSLVYLLMLAAYVAQLYPFVYQYFLYETNNRIEIITDPASVTPAMDICRDLSIINNTVESSAGIFESQKSSESILKRRWEPRLTCQTGTRATGKAGMGVL